MNFKSKQQLFDFIGEHLIRQGKQAKAMIKTRIGNLEIGCAYRTEEGLKCAIGCVIPDDLYVKTMENMSVIMLLEQFDNLPWYIKRNKLFLDKLQSLHDFEFNWPNIKKALMRFGKENRLDISYIESINK